MTTLTSLKLALKHEYEATVTGLSPRQPLSATLHSAGFEILMGGSGWSTPSQRLHHTSPIPPLDSLHEITHEDLGPGNRA